MFIKELKTHTKDTELPNSFLMKRCHSNVVLPLKVLYFWSSACSRSTSHLPYFVNKKKKNHAHYYCELYFFLSFGMYLFNINKPCLFYNLSCTAYLLRKQCSFIGSASNLIEGDCAFFFYYYYCGIALLLHPYYF